MTAQCLDCIALSNVALCVTANTRDVALSPIPFSKPHVVSVRSSLVQPRQLYTYRQRINILQKEVGSYSLV